MLRDLRAVANNGLIYLVMDSHCHHTQIDLDINGTSGKRRVEKLTP